MPINKEQLTAERLRQFPGMGNLTDEQANHLVKSIKALAITLFEHHTKTESDES